MKPTSFSHRYLGIVYSLENQKSQGKIILSFAADSTHQKLEPDDELMVYATINRIKPPLNPHQFNYKAYLEKLGITHQLRLVANNHIVKKNASQTIYGSTASFRNKIISRLQGVDFGKEELGVIQALLLGQRHDLSEATYTNYKNAGAVHILAISGLHIGILLLLLEFLLSPLEYLSKGKTIKMIVIVTLLWGFALLAGLSASVIRAVTMFSFVAYARCLNRPGNTFNILALSMFFILLINPSFLFQVGFQMSYAAVFAIVWIYPLLQKFWFPKNIVLRKMWQLLSVSIAAQFGVLPISLFYFHQFPGLFFVSNMVIVPFLGLILGMGILVIVLSLMNLLPDFLVEAYNFLIRIMNNVIGWIARQEAFVFKDISFDAVQLIISYVILIGLVLVLTKATFKRTTALLSGIIAFQIWLLYTAYDVRTKEEVLILHQNRNSMLLFRKGDKLKLLSSNPEPNKRTLTDYKVAERIRSMEQKPLENSYVVSHKNLYIMDSLRIYPPNENPPDYVLLTQSPRVNLERFIDSVRPKIIIADGSNYKSYIKRWKATCDKRKLPFHYTGEKGAYYFTH